MKDFMYIFRNSVEAEQAYAKLSPEELQADMELWTAWMGDLAAKGKLIGGQPLFPEGKVLKASGKKVTDGPFTEGKDIVGGYLIIKANDFADAVELSKGCPMFNSESGTVEVREVMPIGNE